MSTPQISHTDRDRLVSELIYAILETEARLRRNPTKSEVLDQLFSEDRHDPEAVELAHKLDRVLATLLEDWHRMDEWDERA